LKTGAKIVIFLLEMTCKNSFACCWGENENSYTSLRAAGGEAMQTVRLSDVTTLFLPYFPNKTTSVATVNW